MNLHVVELNQIIKGLLIAELTQWTTMWGATLSIMAVAAAVKNAKKTRQSLKRKLDKYLVSLYWCIITTCLAP